MQKVVVIVGPTAVGKTSISIEVAKRFNGEVINADSVQLYKHLDIGSAKVTKEEMGGVKHHLVSILNPSDDFSASDYATLADAAIKEVWANGHTPIVVGGTGMYVNALLFGLSISCGKDEDYRRKLEALAREGGNDYLYKMLQDVDAESAKKIHPNHISRIIRALEIYHLTGKKKSQFEAETVPRYNYLLIGLNMDRKELYERINRRADIMLEAGLLNEVSRLKKMGITRANKSMQAIGYKESLDLLDGLISEEEFKEKLKQNSRNYAKRQITYFKAMRNIHMVDSQNKEEIFKLIEEFLHE